MNSQIALREAAFDGGVFQPDLAGGRAYGKLSVRAGGLCFRGNAVELTLPMQGLNLKAGGAGNKTLFFTHPSQPETTLFTSDHAMLKHPLLLADPGMAGQISGIQRSKKSSSVFLLLIGLVCIGLIAGLFMLKEPLCIAIAKRVPPKWEQKFADAAMAQIKTRSEFIKDPVIDGQIGRITGPLFGAVPDRRYPFRVHVVKDKSINAFALPGGHIVLNTGLLAAAETPEEIAGVIAHEAAHVTLQHGMRQLIGTVGIYTLVQTFFGDASGLMGVLVNNSAFLLTQAYSRDYEREADDRGWAYLEQAGISPYGMIDFFNKLLEHQKSGAYGELFGDVQNALNFLSTHPTTEERIENLWEKWRERRFENEFRVLDVDMGGLKRRIEDVQ